ncbi:MAG TPA: hypothetical protein PLV92_03045, partial [Pirellulaceae bacterium]|nr:hypothetical protein [Pirellulaceae bacterium]
MTSTTDTDHLLPLHADLASTFAGVAWAAAATADWAAQVFDENLNPYAVVAVGLLSITLPSIMSASDVKKRLIVRGQMRSYADDIVLNVDDADFFGGP